MSSSSAYHFPTNALILKGPRALLHVDRLHMHVVRVDKSHQEMERLRREKGFNYFVDPSAPHASEYARFFTECNGKRLPVSGLFVQLQSEGAETFFAVEDFIRKREGGYIGGVELVSEEFASEHDPTSRVPLLADLRCVWQARERVGGGLSFRSMFHDIPMWFSVTADGDFRVQEHYSASSCDLILEESPTDGWTLHTEDGVRLPAKIRILFPGSMEEEDKSPKVEETE